MIVGLLHPGEMGAAIGAALTGAGHELLWAGEGRSAETTARAVAAGLEDVGAVGAVVERAEVIFSVCPPHAALDVARAVAGFGGLYLDANAVSPQTTRAVGTIVSAGPGSNAMTPASTSSGARFVDGGIVGPPPARPGSTRLYLSGPDAGSVARLFAGTALDARIVSDEIGAASAVKMAYAAWTKGRAALLLAVRELAVHEGVEPALLEEWSLSQPSALREWDSAFASAAAKGWRWRGEMEEIADTFAAAALPDGFHRAAAEIYGAYPRPAITIDATYPRPDEA